MHRLLFTFWSQLLVFERPTWQPIRHMLIKVLSIEENFLIVFKAKEINALAFQNSEPEVLVLDILKKRYI